MKLKFNRVASGVLVQDGVRATPIEVKHYKQLIGKTITEIRFEEFDNGNIVVLGFNDNSTAVVLCDPEGNGPGFLDIQK